jgi:hypothetical protein
MAHMLSLLRAKYMYPERQAARHSDGAAAAPIDRHDNSKAVASSSGAGDEWGVRTLHSPVFSLHRKRTQSGRHR